VSPPPIRTRESFDAAASDYARYRSGYPDAVVDDVVTTSRLHAGSRVLEIGCGTGQLSVPLARRGLQLVAVELGPNLAAFARRNLSGYPGARVEVGGFEEWRLPAEPFDAVVSPFFEPPAPEDAPAMYPELEQRSEFEDVRRHRFEISRRHTTESYVGWLKTDSLILGLGAASRQGFLDDIRKLIHTKYGGLVSRNFVYEVIAASRA
jgi:hypothetical protein